MITDNEYIMTMSSTIMSRFLLLMIKLYQTLLSPILPARCRYYPTCSEYSKTAIRWHGAIKGGQLSLNRIGRCHPLGGHGVDFVPLPLYKYHFHPSPSKSYRNATNVSRETRYAGRGVYKESSSYTARFNVVMNADT